MVNTDEKTILNLIKVLPLFIIIFSIIITYTVVSNNNSKFEQEITKLKNDSLKIKKQSIKKEVERVYDFIKNEELYTISTLKKTIKERTYEAHSITKNIFEQFKNKYSKDEITVIIRSALKKIRFNNQRGYFFVYDKNATNIIHPLLPHLEGKNLINHKDTKGIYVLRESLSLLKNKKESYQEWHWRKIKGDLKEFRKIGFVKNIYELDWFIGTGEYIQNVREDIQKKVLKSLSQIKYSKNKYIFILDANGNLLVHKNKKLIGKNALNLKNDENVMFGRKLLEIAKKGEGFFKYKFTEPTSGKKELKTTFVKGFNQWGWTIGMGVYNTDIKAIIEKKKIDLESKNNDQITSILISSIILTLIFIVFSILFSNIIKEKFKKYKKNVDKNAKALNSLNKTLETQVEKRTKSLNEKANKVTDLLNNSAQGFLSFGKDFLIDEEYSLECEYLLGKDLEKKDISKLLFSKKKEKIEFFKETIIDSLNEKSELTASLLLSLLPKELLIEKRAVEFEYKILSEKKIMMILTNTTEKKKLEIKIKKEQSILKMIVSIVSDSAQFYETKENFEEFVKNSLLFINKNSSVKENGNTIYALLHTFKGLFAQLYMTETVKRIHHIETNLSDFIDKNQTNEELEKTIKLFDLKSTMDKDLEVIVDTLGNRFLEEFTHIKVDEKLINKLENKILSISLLDNEQKQECDEILFDIKRIKNKSLHHYLSIYPELSKQLCLSLNKNIYPFEIEGDRNVFLPDNFKPFINSLIHVFRNCCDHGIEIKEKRIQSHKNEIGQINCKYKKSNDNITIEISDDGKGIDVDILKNKLLKNGIYNEKELDTLLETEIINCIFDTSFSTKENLTDISGRGIGLTAVKIELDKLNGTVEVKTIKDKGSTFIFKLPLTVYQVSKESNYTFDFFDDLVIHTNLNNEITHASKSYLEFINKDLCDVLNKKDSELLELTKEYTLYRDSDNPKIPFIYNETIKFNKNVYYYKTKQELIFDEKLNQDIIKITRKDISSYKRYHDLYTQHKMLLKYVAQGEPLEFILNEIIKSVESKNPNMICSILLLDETKQRLLKGAAPSLPDYYNDAIEGMQIGEKIGSCGAAAYLKQRVIVEDINTHENWAFAKKLAATTNLHACWSQPLFSSKNEIIGTFAIYYNKPKKPTDVDIFLIEDIASITAIALEKYSYQINKKV